MAFSVVMRPSLVARRQPCPSRPSGDKPRCSTNRGQHHAPPKGNRRHQRHTTVVCRADVHWDAFRSPQENVGSSPKPAHESNTPAVRQFDFVVIGSGIGGLSYALKVAEYGSVAIITKDQAHESCTHYAQGGVCAVLEATDSVEKHVRDTVVAGAFLNDLQAVEVVCREGPARVLELVEFGAEFTRNADGTLHLTREGGHSRRRIVHAADFTGREVERALLATARAHRSIEFFENHLAVELVMDEANGVQHCFGVDVLDQKEMHMCRFLGLATMLASGGAGQVYPNTTNPHVSTGDGIAMACRSNIKVANMEFVQFHPTGLYSPGGKGRNFLISEAVRGEGGILYNTAGERFMAQYDGRLELAPRDVVARSIHDQLLSRNDTHVLLDISHKPRAEVLSHFPSIASTCMEHGIDITNEPIPVVPVQHYMCGGVQTGLLGETSVQGLYACGEVSCSGLHGANRLASNSLLEGLVFADRAAGPSVAHAEYAMRHCSRQLHYAAASADFSGSRSPKPLAGQTLQWVKDKRQELRTLMWEACGIVRRTDQLQKALDAIAGMYVETKAVYKIHGVSTELVELFNLVTVGELIVSCALQRKESRGLHFNADYPSPVESECRSSVISSSLKLRYDLTRHKTKLTSVGMPGYTSGNVVKKKSTMRDLSLRSSQE